MLSHLSATTTQIQGNQYWYNNLHQIVTIAIDVIIEPRIGYSAYL